MTHLRLVAGSQVPRDRFMRLPEVMRVSGMSRAAIYALMRDDKFPKSVPLSKRSVGWPESRVLQWVQERIAGADAGTHSGEGSG